MRAHEERALAYRQLAATLVANALKVDGDMRRYRLVRALEIIMGHGPNRVRREARELLTKLEAR